MVDADQSRKVVFMVGRANPPTTGHIKIMLEVLRIAEEEDAIPRIYLTSSHNATKKPLEISYITDNKREHNPRGTPGVAYVKDKKYENPLSPENKLIYVMKMLSKVSGKNEEELREIVKIDRNCNGTYSVFKCVQKIQDDPSNIIYVLGRETDPVERASREKNCKNPENNEDHGSDFKFDCRFVERSLNGENQDMSAMSGSKIRLLVAQKEPSYERFREIYQEYLDEDDIQSFFEAIREGILKPYTAIEKSPNQEPSVVSRYLNSTLGKRKRVKGGKSKKKRKLYQGRVRTRTKRIKRTYRKTYKKY